MNGLELAERIHSTEFRHKYKLTLLTANEINKQQDGTQGHKYRHFDNVMANKPIKLPIFKKLWEKLKKINHPKEQCKNENRSLDVKEDFEKDLQYVNDYEKFGKQ